jgi:hypothetical protein
MGLVSIYSAAAFGYCRTTTCDRDSPPPELHCGASHDENGCQANGIPIHWHKSCVSFSVQRDGSKLRGISADALQAVLRKAFDNWEKVECPGGGKPNIHVETFPQVECDEVRYNSDAKNQNVWMFRDASWPHAQRYPNAIALTSVKFSAVDGTIYNADAEINSHDFPISLEGASGEYYLPAIIQHETGHFYGLAHSSAFESTMLPTGGDFDMSSLSADDIAGICAVFPPVANPELGCDPTPRHGFSTACYDKNTDDGGCAMSPGHVRSTSGFSFSLLLSLVALVGRYRHRRTRDNAPLQCNFVGSSR